MLEYAKSHTKFVLKIESIFSQLILDSQITNKMAFHQFDAMKKPKRKLVHELAALYGLEGCSYNLIPNRYDTRYAHIYTGDKEVMKLPKVLLSEALAKIYKLWN